MMDLAGTIVDAENYGEEPYFFDEEGGYLSGDEIVDLCEDELLEDLEEWRELQEALNDREEEAAEEETWA